MASASSDPSLESAPQSASYLSLRGKISSPWDTNPSFKTRENSPSRRKSTADCWKFIKRLDNDHPKNPEYSHICIVENCSDPFLKLFKPKDKDYWVTSRANEHLKEAHSMVKLDYSISEFEHANTFRNDGTMTTTNMNMNTNLEQRKRARYYGGRIPQYTFDCICKRLLKIYILKENELIQQEIYTILLNQFNDYLLLSIQPDSFDDISNLLLLLKELNNKSLLRHGSYERLVLELNTRLMQGFVNNLETSPPPPTTTTTAATTTAAAAAIPSISTTHAQHPSFNIQTDVPITNASSPSSSSSSSSSSSLSSSSLTVVPTLIPQPMSNETSTSSFPLSTEQSQQSPHLNRSQDSTPTSPTTQQNQAIQQL